MSHGVHKAHGTTHGTPQMILGCHDAVPWGHFFHGLSHGNQILVGGPMDCVMGTYDICGTSQRDTKNVHLNYFVEARTIHTRVYTTATLGKFPELSCNRDFVCTIGGP